MLKYILITVTYSAALPKYGGLTTLEVEVHLELWLYIFVYSIYAIDNRQFVSWCFNNTLMTKPHTFTAARFLYPGIHPFVLSSFRYPYTDGFQARIYEVC